MEVRTCHQDCYLANTLWQLWISRHGLCVVPDRPSKLWKGQPRIPRSDERTAPIDRLEALETCLNALLHIVIKSTLLAFECLRRNKWKSHPQSPGANFRTMLSARCGANGSRYLVRQLPVYHTLGNSRQIPPNVSRSIDANRSLSGLARRIIKISASSITRDRSRSITLHVPRQVHCPRFGPPSLSRD